MSFDDIPSILIDHNTNDYSQAIQDRLVLMTKMKDFLKRQCKYRNFIMGKLGSSDPARYRYDLVIAGFIHNLLSQIPFRKDIHDIETIQYPEVTIKYGGDCDDLSIAMAVFCESIGIPTKWIVAMQQADDFDHIAVYLPTINAVSDLTFPGKYFPLPTTIYPKFQIV